MARQTVLLQGATGETGGEILKGLLEDDNFDVTCLIRPQSADKPGVQDLKNRGVKTLVLDLAQDLEHVAQQIKPYHTIISAIGATAQRDDIRLVDAAAKAGTKRFVPCGFITIAPPGGILQLRDEKEEIHARIWRHKLPYTIIDVGFWHQLSFPRIPSGRGDYAMLFKDSLIYGDGNAPNSLTDKRDIGPFVARIVKDDRTLNKRVFAHADVLSQNQIWELMERKSGEKIERTIVSDQECQEKLEQAKLAAAQDPSALSMLLKYQYMFSKFIRGDNTPEIAKYLGYLDARELYPDFKPISFAEFVDELLAGRAQRPYQGRY